MIWAVEVEKKTRNQHNNLCWQFEAHQNRGNCRKYHSHKNRIQTAEAEEAP